MISKAYPYFDFHCDTIFGLYKSKKSLKSEECMVNLNCLKNYSSAVQTFAVYNDGSYSLEDILSVIDYLKNECNRFSDIISIALNKKDIDNNMKLGKISALIAIEGLGNQLEYSTESIDTYYKNGVRVMGLCHNGDNVLCTGVTGNGTGVTSLGKTALRRMQSLGIILDVSHMSDSSFWESAAEYSLPFCATHSNSRKIFNNPRNLTDDQFLCIAKRGGLAGVNLFAEFVGGDGGISALINHIEHFLSLGGENNICIGSDFDGMPNPVAGIDNAGLMYKLFDKLLSLNYNETLVNKLAFNNFHNFLNKFETFA